MKRHATPEFTRIAETVAAFFCVTLDQLVGRRRFATVVLPRQVAMYVIRQRMNAGVTEIGEFFDRDHTTVIHGIKAVERYILADENMAAQVDYLTRELNKPAAVGRLAVPA